MTMINHDINSVNNCKISSKQSHCLEDILKRIALLLSALSMSL